MFTRNERGHGRDVSGGIRLSHPMSGEVNPGSNCKSDKMVEVPTAVGAAGVKLSGISQADHDKFSEVVASIEEYSQSLVTNFQDATTKIHERLEENGAAALQALQKLAQSRDSLETMVKENGDVLEQIMNEVDPIVKEIDGLDSLQSELLLLSDLLTTVEETVKHSKAQ